MHSPYTPDVQIFISFALRWAIFELHTFFGKVHRMTQKWPWWHVGILTLTKRPQGQKYQHAFYIHPRGPYFCLFHSTMSHFRVTGQVSGKVHRMTPNNRGDMFKVKNTNMHATSNPEAQIAVHFTLWWLMSRFSVAAQFSEKWIAVWYIIWKSSSSCTYIVFVPLVVEIELIFALRAPASKI